MSQQVIRWGGSEADPPHNTRRNSPEVETTCYIEFKLKHLEDTELFMELMLPLNLKTLQRLKCGRRS